MSQGTGAQDRDREQRRARHAQRVAAIRAARQRKPATSVTTTVDPFELVATGRPAGQPLPF